MTDEAAPIPAPPRHPVSPWGWTLIASAVLTALSLGLPWQKTAYESNWAWQLVEGWVAGAAMLVGLVLAGMSLPPGWPIARRRRATAFSLLCALVVLGAVGVLAVRMLSGERQTVASGAGSVAASALVLVWIFAAVRRHVELRRGRQGAKAGRRPP